jgi:phosphate transport system permease protein
MPTSLLSCGRTLSLHIYHSIAETNDVEGAMATAAVLIITILVINTITNWLSNRFQRRMKGAA